MRRLLPVFLSALALALVLLPLTHAAAAEKEFSDAGVKWKLPDGWSFSPVSGAEKGAGFFAKVECSSASVEVWAYAKASDGLDVAQRAAELKQAGAEGMGSVQKTKVLDTTLSGVKGKVVVQRIQADGGTPGHFRKYVIVSGGKFYQLLMRCWHDAHSSVGDEINAVRQGFRLLKGAGGKDATETLSEVDEAAAKDDDDDDSDDDEGDDEDDDGWPRNGPKKEGRKVSMDNHNFRWDLPEASKFEWTGATDNVNQQDRPLHVRDGSGQAQKKKEYEKNTPRQQRGTDRRDPAQHESWVQARRLDQEGEREGLRPEAAGLPVQGRGVHQQGQRQVRGNHRASFVKFNGTFKGKKRVVDGLRRDACAARRTFVSAVVQGHTDAYKQMAPLVGKAIKGNRVPRDRRARPRAAARHDSGLTPGSVGR